MRIGIVSLIILTTSVQLFSATPVKGQPIDQVEISIELKNESLVKAFQKIEAKSPFHFMYRNEEVKNIRNLHTPFGKQSVAALLKTILSNTSLNFRQIDNRILITTSGLENSDFISESNEPFNELINASKDVVVKGQVIDAKGEPLIGVSVKLKGTNAGVSTDINGQYSLTMSDGNGILVFTYIGFVMQEVVLNNRQTVNVVLIADAKSLDEIIVIGYGTTTKRDLTGSVGKADIVDMQKAPVPSFDNALAGRIAGVHVVSTDGQPGGATRITIRGSSVSQDASPLYVIDGFPVENMDISSINPQDIESLEVLKDASSIAIYGARGANGVIIVTTKKGSVGPPKISYNYSAGVSKDINRVEMMDPYEFVKLQLEIDQLRSTAAAKQFTNSIIYLGYNPANNTFSRTLDSYKDEAGYDWQDLVLQTGSQQNHSISMNGGTDNTRYAVSASAFDQTGIITNTGFKRYEGQISLDQTLSKKLKAGVSARYSNSKNFGTVPIGANSGGVVQGMWQYRPASGVGNQDLLNSLIDSAALADFNNGVSTSLGDNLINPYLQAKNEIRNEVRNTGYLNAYVEYLFSKDFKLKISGGYNGTVVNQENFYNSQTQQGNTFKNPNGSIPNVNGINGAIAHQLNENYLSENILTYKKKISKIHSFDLLGGFTYQYAKSTGTGFNVTNIPQAQEYLGLLSLNTGRAGIPRIGGTHWQLFSFIGRFNYTLKDKYLFTTTSRYDGSSKFTPGKQWGFFPSAAFAWRFTAEPFMKKFDFLEDGKLRVSYGSVGNNKVGDFSYLPQYGNLTNSHGYPLNNEYFGGVSPFFYGNDNLTWETTNQLDLGINLSLFKGKISVEADYYNKISKNFLLGATLPAFAGYSNGANSQYQNAGSIRNRGFEFTINTVNISNKNFGWKTSFNISFNQGKILSFNSQIQSISTPVPLPGVSTANRPIGWIAQIGSSISDFYGFKWGGVYQFQDFDKLANGNYVLKNGISTYSTTVQPGDAKYQDINGDGVISDADRTYLGSPLPVHLGGFSNIFSYKNFDLSIFMQWSYGSKILNANKIVFEQGYYTPYSNQFASFNNRWTPDNPTNDLPRAQISRGDAGNPNPRISSRVIEDGSFIRLKTISLGYTLAKNVLPKIGLSDVKLNLSAQNILTLTRYSGTDPEVSTFRVTNEAGRGTGYTFIQPSSGYTALAGGLDYTPYPRAFILSFGLTANF